MNVCTIVTNKIIEELENGVIPWHKPWCGVRGGAYNLVTHNRYSLSNQMLLKHNGAYATYRQWMGFGKHVRIKEGENPEIVIFWKWPEERDIDDNNRDNNVNDKKIRPVLRYYKVFHESQVDGVDVVRLDQPVLNKNTSPIDFADELIDSYVNRNGIVFETVITDDAYYDPKKDLIHVPDIKQYKDANEYYSTVFHEVIHSTGHGKRLDRTGLKLSSFGSNVYGKEELVAEVGSAAIMHTIGIDTDNTLRNSAAYIEGWLKAIRGNEWLIISAASKAEKAVNFVLNNR